MAQYIKKKIKNQKKNKNIIQYQEVDDDPTCVDNEDSKISDNQHNSSPEYLYENQNTVLLQESELLNNSSLFHTVDIAEESKNQEDQQDPNTVCVESDAWPEEQQVQVKSKYHKIIRKKLDKISPQKLYFKQLEEKHVKEVKNLHEEWFPLSYPDTFYDRIKRNNVIAIGCFIDLDKQNKKVILGSIMVKINNGNEDIKQIHKAKDMDNGGIFGWLSSTLMCKEQLGAYIMTLGVVDECRRFGIGTMLLNECIKIINQNWINCEVIYLHVVDYNESAIRYYEKNNFQTLKRMKNHYVIFEKSYDGLLLYRDIKIAMQDKSFASSPDNERNMSSPIKNNETPQEANGLISYFSYPIKYVYQKFI